MLALGTGLLLSGPASAHMGTGLPGGFMAGFMHPLGGFDHLLAMVSVGVWGAFLGRPLIYVLPVVFPAMMVVVRSSECLRCTSRPSKSSLHSQS